jgi:hypothetical protein
MATSHDRVKLARAIVASATKRITSAKGEAEARHAEQHARRLASPTILTANDVSGEYDAKRLLMTTLGGTVRPITNADLRAFASNRQLFKNQFRVKGRGKTATYTEGITAQQVIDMSLHIDKKRANDQIRTSMIVGAQADVFHFVTSAGPDSDVNRHHVHVQFLELDNQFNNPVPEKDKRKLGKLMANGRLKFQCDCGRYRYWFRYLCTVGNFAYGLQEHGFPRVRNPNLTGVGCKHVLRTMHNIQKDATIHKKLVAQLEKLRASSNKAAMKYEREKAADVRAQGEKQAARGKSATIRLSPSKAHAAAQAKALSQAMERKAADKARRAMTPDQRKSAADTRKAIAGLQQALKFGGITQAQYDALVANLGVKTK